MKKCSHCGNYSVYFEYEKQEDLPIDHCITCGHIIYHKYHIVRNMQRKLTIMPKHPIYSICKNYGRKGYGPYKFLSMDTYYNIPNSLKEIQLEKLYTIKELASMFNVQDATIRRWIKVKKIFKPTHQKGVLLNEKLYTQSESAKLLKQKKYKIIEWIKSGKLKYINNYGVYGKNLLNFITTCNEYKKNGEY